MMSQPREIFLDNSNLIYNLEKEFQNPLISLQKGRSKYIICKELRIYSLKFLKFW